MMKKLLIMTAVLLSVLALPLFAEGEQEGEPYKKTDGTWISISGTVTNVEPHEFTLDYGEGFITVEMDDWDNDADAYKLQNGENVTVNGVIDADLFEATTIEAGSVYVEGENTYFYASSVDEEDSYMVNVVDPVVVSEVTLEGEVTGTGEEQFTIDSGLMQVTVDTSTLPYDPLDDEGYQEITEGQRVSVSGTLINDFFEDRELIADSVITLEWEAH